MREAKIYRIKTSVSPFYGGGTWRKREGEGKRQMGGKGANGKGEQADEHEDTI